MNTKQWDIIRALLCGFLLLWLMMSAVISVSATGCEFSLSSAQAGVGRLLEVSFECEGEKALGAFVAEIEYDAEVLEYKSAKVTDEDAEFSIYTPQAGRLRFVYLCEDGVNCIDKTPLAEITFKALKSGTCQLSAMVQEAIDTDSSDVQVNRSIPAVISISASDSVKSAYKGSTDNADAEESVQSSATEVLDTESEIIYVSGKEFSVALVVSAVAVALIIVCLVVLLAYKLGARSAGKKE